MPILREGVHAYMCVHAWFFISYHHPFDTCFLTRLQEMRSVLSRNLVGQEPCVSLGTACFPKRPCQGCMCCTQGHRLAKTMPRKTVHSTFNQVVKSWRGDSKTTVLKWSQSMLEYHFPCLKKVIMCRFFILSFKNLSNYSVGITVIVEKWRNSGVLFCLSFLIL